MVLYPPAKSCNTDVPGMTLENNSSSESLQVISSKLLVIINKFFMIIPKINKYYKTQIIKHQRV